MKTFKNKAKKSAWIMKLLVIFLVPIVFFLVAVTEGRLYPLAGVMTVLVVFVYVLEGFGVGKPVVKKS